MINSKQLSVLLFFVSIMFNMQLNAAAIVEKDSKELAENISFRSIDGGKRVEVALIVPQGYDPDVACLVPGIDFRKGNFNSSKNIRKIPFKKDKGKIVFTVTNEEFGVTKIELYKMVSGAKPGETGGVFNVYKMYLRDFVPKLIK